MRTIVARTVGEALRDAREEMGFNLRQVTAELGVNKSTLSRIENNISHIKPQLLMRLAQLYELPAADLFALAGYVDPSSLPDMTTYLQIKYGLTDEQATLLDDYRQSLQADEVAPATQD